MADTPRRYSTGEVRRRIWQVLGRHALPILLALLLVSLPMIAAGVLDGVAFDLHRQRNADRAALQAEIGDDSSLWTPEQKELFQVAWERDAQLNLTAGRCRIAAALLLLAGLIIARPLLYGVDLVLITILRGGEFRWRDALLTWSEFRQGFRLACYSYLCLLMTALPGYLVILLGGFMGDCFGLTAVDSVLDVIGLLIMAVMVFGQLLRFQLAPRLLADGAEGTSAELVGLSTEILDLRSLLPMLSILFPGLLMALSALLLQGFVLSALLPGWLSGLLMLLMHLPAWGYLLTAGAAIYTTFRTDESSPQSA